MVGFVEIIILSAALLCVAYPLLSRKVAEPGAAALTESDYTDLLYRKEATLIALKDLDFDFKTGKIDDADYNEVKTGLESDAMEILRNIEQFDKGVSQPAAQAAAQERPRAKNFCHNCGAPAGKSHKFCSECGARLG